MSHGSHCRKTDLIRSQALHITHCACGMIGLHLGPVSLRISESAFQGLADAVVSASLKLAALTHGHEPAALPARMRRGDFQAG